MPEELPTALEIGHQVKICICLETKFQSHEERGVQGTLQDLALSNCMRDFLFSNDFLLGQDFHGIYTLRIPLPDLEHFPKGPPADELKKFKISGGESTFCLLPPRPSLFSAGCDM